MTTQIPEQNRSPSRQTIASTEKNDALWFIRSSDFFSQIGLDNQKQLLDLGEKRFFKKGETIFRAGSPGEHVYILLDGRVKIYQLSSIGREVILWFCFPGELFGLAEILRSERRKVFSQSCCDCEILVIGQSAFTRFLQECPLAATSVIDLLSCRLRELGNVHLNVASDDVTSRVVKLMTRLAARYGKRIQGDIYLDIPITHQEMADMIGSSRQTVTEVLGHLRRQGVLRVENRTIFIQNIAWLENATDAENTDITPAPIHLSNYTQ
jgi:CRP/FNR family transcriptional regulator